MKRYISAGTWIDVSGDRYRIKYMIDGFDYNRAKFNMFDEAAFEQFYDGDIITRNGNEYYILVEDEYGHESEPNNIFELDEFLSEVY